MDGRTSANSLDPKSIFNGWGLIIRKKLKWSRTYREKRIINVWHNSRLKACPQRCVKNTAALFFFRQKTARFVYSDLYFLQRLLNLYGFSKIQSAQYLLVSVEVGRVNTETYARLIPTFLPMYFNENFCTLRFLRFAVNRPLCRLFIVNINSVLPWPSIEL